jgi:hypothetical protein
MFWICWSTAVSTENTFLLRLLTSHDVAESYVVEGFKLDLDALFGENA